MTDENLINITIDFVKHQLKNAEAGHDWFHIERVYKNSLLIAKTEDCNLEIVSLGALLHDIADAKFHDGDEKIGPKIARKFLTNQKVDASIADHVVQIIEHISFRGGNTKSSFTSKELSVVQDADRLDAMGAIGVARAFHYGGFKNREIYNPKTTPNLKMTKAQYKKSTAPTVNHFYEKLFLLKEKMNTQTGFKMAQNRHAFMELYLKQFYDEWDGVL